MEKKAVIIGAGPAGTTAAIYLQRAKVDVTVIYKGMGSLEKSEKIGNYYGAEDNPSGKELWERGFNQAKVLGVKFIKSQVMGLSYDEKFSVLTEEEIYTADALIIATGAERNKPKIDNLERLEGFGVSYCATCDAFFYKNLSVGVLGNSKYALHEARELLPIASKVTIFTNGLKPEVEFDNTMTVDTRKISKLLGEDALSALEFEDGEKTQISGLFVAMGVASSFALASKIGAVTEKDRIVVDENMQTNVPGLFAAGDCTGGLLQISKAVGDGAKAATSAIKHFRS